MPVLEGCLSTKKWRNRTHSAAKAGLQSLTRNAAIEWAKQGIRVNAIVVGIMMTPATEAAIPDAAAS